MVSSHGMTYVTRTKILMNSMESSMIKEKIRPIHIDKLKQYGLEITNTTDATDIHVFRFNKNEVVLREGHQMDYLMFVVSGRAKVYSTAENGRDLLLSYYLADGIIGDLELMLDEYTARTTMIALTDFVCIALPYEKWATTLRANNRFLNAVGYALSTKLLESSGKGVATALHGGETRLCAYLSNASHDGIIDEPLTNISSAIGLSYRQTLRILKKLCTEHTLMKVDQGYKIIDKKSLEEKGIHPNRY